MTTWATLLADLYTLTNKPNLAAESAIALRKATMDMHCVAFFARDLVEGVTTLATAGYNHALVLGTEYPRLRAFNYLRKYDSVSLEAGALLTYVEPQYIFDEYNVEKNDVFYLGGTNVNVRSSTSIGALKYGYFAYPVVTPTGSYSSWIADAHEEIILEAAAMRIFSIIGDLEQAGAMRNAVGDYRSGNVKFLLDNYTVPAVS